MIEARTVDIPAGSARSLHFVLDHLTVLELERLSCHVLGALRAALEKTPFDSSAHLSEKRSVAGSLGVCVPKSGDSLASAEVAHVHPFRHLQAARCHLSQPTRECFASSLVRFSLLFMNFVWGLLDLRF